eukprot:TRINITY_DN20876_c0_g1_i1.p1 TRINITY_DN20876_c0_g1~~TRINITY_DN20876_c0_g1_i1.p1  ORF type:complete len:658 (+),score=135.61 TRINITY_DN20876_c0_g1_i1:29-1975(+)
MADYVEQAMQDMVPELDDLARKNIFNEDEIRHIVRRRRDFEYGLQRKPGSPHDYLGYVRYEVALESLRRRRSLSLGWKKRTVSDYAGIKRVHMVLRRACFRWKGDIRMFYQHVDFCLRSGSTKALSRVLLRALKFHPKEVGFWLLAADRELQLGHVEAARKLLMRGLRCLPKSVKILTEFVRLEAGIAGQLLAAQQLAEEDEASPADKSSADVWAPARLIFRKGLARLAAKPTDSVIFLRAVAGLLHEAQAKWSESKGLAEWAEALRLAASDRRPGALAEELVAAGSGRWLEVPEEAALIVWEVWWTEERRRTADARPSWTTLAAACAAADPGQGGALAKLAEVLAKEIATEGVTAVERDDCENALLQVAAASGLLADPEATLAVLECLAGELPGCRSGKPSKKMQEAHRSLLQKAAATNPGHLRLGLLAGAASASAGAGESKASVPAALLRRASGLGSTDAAQLLLVVSNSPSAPEASPAAKRAKKLETSALEQLVRALAPGQSPAPLVAAKLANAAACGEASEFRKACDEVRNVATNCWEVPGRRAQLLAAVLDVELRAGQERSPTEAKRLVASFEELLTALAGGQAEEATTWWLRYAEFGLRAASSWEGAKVPSQMDINTRAMRVVPDQGLFQEKMQALLRGFDG